MRNLFTMMWPSRGLGETIAVGERSYVTGLLNFEDLQFFTDEENVGSGSALSMAPW
jgi:hypothetical protein